MLFALMGYDTSASQKTKITRKSIAVRCKQFCRGRKGGQTTKRPQGILLCIFKVFEDVWALFLPVKTVCVLVNRGYTHCIKCLYIFNLFI